MANLHLQFLGDFQIVHGDKPLPGFDAPRLQALLAFLVLHRDAPQSRKHLAFLLWQDSSEQQAHGNLRTLVHRLKKTLPDFDAYVATDTQTLQWREDAPYTADITEFQALVSKESAPGDDEAVTRRLSDAVSLYRGELLPACYDEWLLPERERLRELFVDALARLVALYEAQGEIQSAIGCARRLLQTDPLSEEVYRKLMQLYARVGDRGNVLRVYQTCVAVLERELSAEPSAATRETFERLRHQEVSRPRAAEPRAQVKPHLPTLLTSFIGRTRELDDIGALLKRARLVTLTGVGGGGKTRLAIRAAQQVAPDFSDGVWFADIAPLANAADVPSLCAAVLGLYEEAGTSVSRQLAEYCHDKELLLILDNCEHLLGACAELVQTILQRAPRVRVLATSREPLNLAGEALLTVPPLSLPDPRGMTLAASAQSDAVQLFTTRAAFILPTFTLHEGNLEAVVRICRQLDGIPLAIELAAARVRTLTPQQIATRLDDVLSVLTRGSSSMPARHQTMRAVLDWSDALLGNAERDLFRHLAVFVGGFTLEAAEFVCGDPAEPTGTELLDLLSNLIDKSLVTMRQEGDEMRYRMLEPVREYARDKLRTGPNAKAEENALAARHLEYFMRLAERAEPELTGPEQRRWLERLEADYDNLRAALGWELPDVDEQRVRLAGALWRFLFARGKSVEGHRLLSEVLRTSPGASAAARAKCYSGLGTMAWLCEEYTESIAWHEHALALYREIDDTSGIAHALVSIGGAYVTLFDYERGTTYIESSLALARDLGDPDLMTNVLTALGESARYQGDYERARELNEQARAVAIEHQHWQFTALALNNLSLVATRQGEFERAIQLARQALELYRTGGEIHFVPECLEGLAAALHASKKSDKAAILLGASDALRTSIHLPVPPIEQRDYERVLAEVRTELQGDFRSRWSRGRAMTMEQAIDFALEESG